MGVVDEKRREKSTSVYVAVETSRGDEISMETSPTGDHQRFPRLILGDKILTGQPDRIIDRIRAGDAHPGSTIIL